MSDRTIVSDVEDVSAEDREIWVKPVARTRNLTVAESAPTGSADFSGGS
ncbi:hypothetical protein [Tistrella mobilis]|nr:hypothetical protein [Tistrella mobilis]